MSQRFPHLSTRARQAHTSNMPAFVSAKITDYEARHGHRPRMILLPRRAVDTITFDLWPHDTMPPRLTTAEQAGVQSVATIMQVPIHILVEPLQTGDRCIVGTESQGWPT